MTRWTRSNVSGATSGRLLRTRETVWVETPATDIAASVPESTLIDDSEIATEQLRELRACGIRTALDDFGTGYSSLAYVQRLPLDIIKIDKEFVQSVDEGRSQALANTIVNMARNLGLRTVAEGIETESQAVELARLGCEFAQGYLFFKPLSAVAMTALAEFENQPGDAASVAPRQEISSAPPALAAPAVSALPAPLPPPTGRVPVLEATAQDVVEATVDQPPEAATQTESGAEPRQSDERRPDEPTGEITHLLRPLLSN